LNGGIPAKMSYLLNIQIEKVTQTDFIAKIYIFPIFPLNLKKVAVLAEDVDGQSINTSMKEYFVIFRMKDFLLDANGFLCHF
jgi:hypothetical protein